MLQLATSYIQHNNVLQFATKSIQHHAWYASTCNSILLFILVFIPHCLETDVDLCISLSCGL